MSSNRWLRRPQALQGLASDRRILHRTRTARRFAYGLLSVMLGLLLAPPEAGAYRPFASTDAAVVDPQEVEVELGYFTLKRARGEEVLTLPGLVLNYGLLKDLEIVGELGIERDPAHELQVVDPGLFLKAVLKDGLLQERPGVSIAAEAGLLLPSTVEGEGNPGFEGIAVVSGRLPPLMVHLSVGGGVDRGYARPFWIWGVIGELPVRPGFRLVGELSGESTRGELPDNSALMGFIWQPSSRVSLDAGVRWGLSRDAPDWLFTLGMTFGFSLSLSQGRGLPPSSEKGVSR